MMKTYHGTCHCGVVRFAAEIDLRERTLRCNCSYCLKIRCWVALVEPASFHLLAGQSELTEYQFNPKNETHYFCRHCGVRPFGLGNSPRFGAFYGVNVTCLDDASASELADAPISYVDGAADRWDAVPAQTRHL